MMDSQSSEAPLRSSNKANDWLIRLSIISLITLFLLTLLNIINGFFNVKPAEVKLFDIIYFIVGIFLITKLISKKEWARILYITFFTIDSLFALSNLIKNYNTTIPSYSSLMNLEYAITLIWRTVTILLLIYLMCPQMRELFTKTEINIYKRLFFFISFFNIFLSFIFTEFSNLNSKLIIKIEKNNSSESLRYSSQCLEVNKAIVEISDNNVSLIDYCNCESYEFSKLCSPIILDRNHCVSSLLEKPENITSILEIHEKCLEKNVPSVTNYIFEKKRKILDENFKYQIALLLPFHGNTEDKEKALSNCVSHAILAMCMDYKLSSTYKCLKNAASTELMENTIVQCNNIINGTFNTYENYTKECFRKISEGNLTDAQNYAEKIIQINPDKVDGYMCRSEISFKKSKPESIIKDTTIILNLSDYPSTKIKALKLREEAFRLLKKEDAISENKREICSLKHPIFCNMKVSQESDSKWSEIALESAIKETIKAYLKK